MSQKFIFVGNGKKEKKILFRLHYQKSYLYLPMFNYNLYTMKISNLSFESISTAVFSAVIIGGLLAVLLTMLNIL